MNGLSKWDFDGCRDFWRAGLILRAPPAGPRKQEGFFDHWSFLSLSLPFALANYLLYAWIRKRGRLAMSRSAEPDSKRRRTYVYTPNFDDAEFLSLENLPHDHIISIADYLPKTSRALFAVALTAPSSSFFTSCWEGKICDASKAIISSTRPSRYNIPFLCKRTYYRKWAHGGILQRC